MRIYYLFLLVACIACENADDTRPETDEVEMNVVLSFSEELPRLGNLGTSVTVAPGNAAQSPDMQSASLHYIELAPSALTPLESGAIIYQGAETRAGGERAVDFDNAPLVGNGEQFVTISLSDIPPGTYEWVRVSLTYQNFDINYLVNLPPHINNQEVSGRVASFVGFNTYITEHIVKDSLIRVDANKKQGYWALESNLTTAGQSFGSVVSGDGAGVTVVNPIADTSPVPAGSCVVTGRFTEPLVITELEQDPITLHLDFSINNSFEWKEITVDGKYEPLIGEQVVDMGLRGLHPRVE